jgi:hypothetical protein
VLDWTTGSRRSTSAPALPAQPGLRPAGPPPAAVDGRGLSRGHQLRFGSDGANFLYRYDWYSRFGADVKMEKCPDLVARYQQLLGFGRIGEGTPGVLHLRSVPDLTRLAALLSGGAVTLAGTGALQALPDGQRRCVPKGLKAAALALACFYEDEEDADEEDGCVRNRCRSAHCSRSRTRTTGSSGCWSWTRRTTRSGGAMVPCTRTWTIEAIRLHVR